MSENTLNIGKWKDEYPFLKNVWNTIDDFDKALEMDQNYNGYSVVCNQIIDLSKGEREKHKDVCMKLVRNLGHRSNNLKFLSHRNERCNTLNNWIYISMKKHNIQEKIITECFEEYNYHMRSIREDPRCSYYSYDHTYFEPMKIVELKIFLDNMNVIRNTLLQEYEKNKIPLHKYICEYVNIYKVLNSTYCSYEVNKSKKHTDTCKILENFKTSYMSFLYNDLDKKSVIPSLYDVEKEYKDKCLPSKLEVLPSASMDNAGRTSSSLAVDIDEKQDYYSSPRPLIDENAGSSMSRTVSTAVGTMAGASSIIALLYKFTPGRNWMRSGSRGRISNNLYSEQANELFYDGFEGEVMSSHNPTYNVGYGSV